MVLNTRVSRFRALAFAALLLVPTLFALIPSTRVDAAGTVGNCTQIDDYLSVQDGPSTQLLPQYDVQCFGVHLEGGRTYVINVDADPPPDPTSTSVPTLILGDSVLKVAAHKKQGVWLGTPSLQESDYTYVAYNDDISYPDNLSSRVTITADGEPGSSRLYVIIVKGYSWHLGAYTVDVYEPISLPELPDCRFNWWLPECLNPIF